MSSNLVNNPLSNASLAKIQLVAVSKTFNEATPNQVEAIRDIDFSIRSGEIYCLLGPSGCGKTTVLNMIAGFDSHTKGQILLDGKPVGRPGPDRAVVFQQPILYPWMTVLKNITVGLDAAGIKPLVARTRALKYIADIGLSGFEHRYPYELSGGMQQRVAIARAWVIAPSVLLLDEPFGALDAQTRITMQELLLDLWDQDRTTILFITHDIDEAIFLGDRIGVMSRRPATLRTEITVPLPRPRTVEITTAPEFVAIKREILHYLREEAQLR